MGNLRSITGNRKPTPKTNGDSKNAMADALHKVETLRAVNAKLGNEAVNFAVWVWAQSSDPTTKQQAEMFLQRIGVNATAKELAEKAGYKPASALAVVVGGRVKG